MNYLSLCAIVKDENPYLPEWIEYHKIVGIERFFIYDNESQIPVNKTLAKDIATGIVTVIPTSGFDKQRASYMDCISRFGKSTAWMAFIDVDEFICPHKTDDLRVLLRDYESFGGLGINWQVFGTSGHIRRPAGLQIEGFTLKASNDYGIWNKHIKTIAQPSFVKDFPNPHHCDYRRYWCVNEKMITTHGAFSEFVSVERVQVNHYVTRSRSEFEEKCARGAPDGNNRRLALLQEAEEHFGDIEDLSITRFADKVKSALRQES